MGQFVFTVLGHLEKTTFRTHKPLGYNTTAKPKNPTLTEGEKLQMQVIGRAQLRVEQKTCFSSPLQAENSQYVSYNLSN